MRLRRPLAQNDLEEIGDYIAQDNPGRALTFIQEIRAQMTRGDTREHLHLPPFEIEAQKDMRRALPRGGGS